MAYLIILLLCFYISHGAADFEDYLYHPCARNCDKTAQNMNCTYKFSLDFWITNTLECGGCLRGNIEDCYNSGCIVADGRNNLVAVYNRMLPGPAIQVCLNDRIILVIENEFVVESTSIHWHGMHQRQTQWMDGVPYITQCPINPLNSFQYDFYARTVGTHFYHSHSGMQRADGAFGALIVRTANDSNKIFYDFDLPEHTILLTDWTYLGFSQHIKRYQILKQPLENITSAILVNNLGSTRFNKVPPARFRVKYGFKYRFRFIHAGAAMCPIAIQIQGHRLQVIAVDGQNIVPYTVDTIFIENGERLDVVIKANQMINTYWIKFTSGPVCDFVEGMAFLDYRSSSACYKSTFPLSLPMGLALNCINTPQSKECIRYDQLTSRAQQSALLYKQPDVTLYFEYDFADFAEPKYRGPGDEILITPIINNITFKYPDVPLLLQGEKHTYYCNMENREVCPKNETICACTHVIEIPIGSLVEIIFIHRGIVLPIASHPMHLHGYAFNILYVQKIGGNLSINSVKEMDRRGLLKRNMNNPVQKDTFGMPTEGVGIIRFLADNQGFWFMHCHVENHAEEGMGFVLKTGNIPYVPPNFPTCGDYSVDKH